VEGTIWQETLAGRVRKEHGEWLVTHTRAYESIRSQKLLGERERERDRQGAMPVGGDEEAIARGYQYRCELLLLAG